MRRIGSAVVVVLVLATSLGGCAAGLSAEADAWCKANPDPVFKVAMEQRQGGTTSGWDPTKEEFQRACQAAYDKR